MRSYVSSCKSKTFQVPHTQVCSGNSIQWKKIKRKAESKAKSSKPKKRTVELSISSDSDANIDEKDLVQSDPEIDEDSDEETLMIQ